jgi:hypothetical protein
MQLQAKPLSLFAPWSGGWIVFLSSRVLQRLRRCSWTFLLFVTETERVVQRRDVGTSDLPFRIELCLLSQGSWPKRGRLKDSRIVPEVSCFAS